MQFFAQDLAFPSRQKAQITNFKKFIIQKIIIGQLRLAASKKDRFVKMED